MIQNQVHIYKQGCTQYLIVFNIPVFIMLSQSSSLSTLESSSIRETQDFNSQFLKNINSTLQTMNFKIVTMMKFVQSMDSNLKYAIDKFETNKSHQISHLPQVSLNNSLYPNSKHTNFSKKKEISEKLVVPKSSKLTQKMYQSKKRQLQEAERELKRIQKNPNKLKELQYMRIKRSRISKEIIFFANKIYIEQLRRMEIERKMKTEMKSVHKIEWKKDKKVKKQIQHEKDIEMAVGLPRKTMKVQQKLQDQRVKQRRIITETLRQRDC